MVSRTFSISASSRSAGRFTNRAERADSISSKRNRSASCAWAHRRCARCRSGRYNLCPDVIFAATPPCDGALIELVCYPADFCFPLPDGVTTDVGSLAEPICCGVHTAERGSISLGDRVAILGDGPIALSTLMAVQASGGRVVMLTGLVAERMKLAEELGAERVLNAAQEDVVAAGKALDVDVAIDCAGAPATPQQCIDIVRRGGRAVLIGLPSTDSTPINVPRCIAKEVDVIAVMRYANNFPAAVELLRRRLTDARKLITHRFGFSQVADAFKLVHELRDGVIKAVIDFGK